jgi:hypothetical protein
MANNKYSGYTPKKETTVPNEGSPGSGNRLDRVNPYEFRKGMDLELTSLGVSRLAESTVEEREKATETVIKNLEENGGYYSALIQFNRGMNHAGPINEKTFKQYLETYKSEFPGTGMKEVKKAFQFGKMEDADHKNDKMTEPKYDKKEYTTEFKTDMLKEAIKAEVKSMLLEAKKDDDDFDGPDDDKLDKDFKKKMGTKKKKDRGDDLDAELNDIKKAKSELEEKHEKAKEKSFPKYQKDKDVKAYKDALSLKDKEINKLKSLANKYTGKETGYNIPANITYKEAVTLLNKRVTANKKEQEQFLKDTLKEKRDISNMEMTREDHMRLLEIIKEAGVSLREGSGAIKVQYEIAKASYLEGIAKGMKI